MVNFNVDLISNTYSRPCSFIMNFGRLMFKIQSINGRSVIYPCGMLRAGLEGDGGGGGRSKKGNPLTISIERKIDYVFVPLPKFFSRSDRYYRNERENCGSHVKFQYKNSRIWAKKIQNNILSI